jgi:tetratricopeptide (TPR) repeat protein
MTTNPDPTRQTRFVTGILPWVVAAASLALYLLTVSHWVTLNSFLPFSRVAGLQWHPVLASPVYHVLTLPLKLLPAAWIPLALNLFSALCAPLVLALLARSVALLPQDRTHPQRMAEKSFDALLTIRAAWLPVVFAVLVCGLQFAFWERATAGGPEMFDLLLFAYVVRCLLEYRREGRESWLFKAVFVYAAGMTENWLLVLLLPVFLVALVWHMGFGFFSARFLARAWLLSLLGLSFYLLLPLLAMFHAESPVGYWPALKYILAGQKNTIAAYWKFGQDRLALAGLTSLLPMFVIALKFRTNYGDTSRLGTGLATFCFHVLHGALLIVCGWVALDPEFKYKGSLLQLGPDFLVAKYLAALALGYFCGYFLLIFGERARLTSTHRELEDKFNRAVVAGVWGFAAVVVAALVYRTPPLIRGSDGAVLREYASLLIQKLPSKPAVFLSDDPRRLWLAQAALAAQANSPKHLAVDTRLLVSPDYHRTLNRKSAGLWPLPPTNRPTEIDPLTLVDRMLKLASEREVYYLHPSFGYYFEFLRPEPHGIIHRLVPYGTNELLSPPLSVALVEENENFWTNSASACLARLDRLMGRTDTKVTTNLFERLLQRGGILPGKHGEALEVAKLHSRSLNHWGVQLQRSGYMTAAGAAFARAEQLNPLNVPAEVNREFNRKLIAGNKATVTLTSNIEDKFEAYRTWDQMIGENGPFDEPTFSYEQGRVFALATLYRQALHEFERVRSLATDDIPSRLWLANIYLNTRLFDQALSVAEEVKTHPERFALTATNRTDFLHIEASARMARGDATAADGLLQAAVSRDPTNYYLLAVTAQVYMRNGWFTNAQSLFDQQLRLRPGDTDALMNKGYVCLQSGAYREAVVALDRLLRIQTNNHPALVNRAIAHLRLNELDAAERDYASLRDLYPTAYQVYYGLGEIAWRRSDTNAALGAYEKYFSNAPPNTAEAKVVAQRYGQLKSAKP